MNRSPRPLVITAVALVAATTATSPTAKVLRSQDGTATVFVFKDAFTLDRFSKLSGSAVSDANAVETLLTCKVPQGSRIIVLGSGYRTAFVRVTDGSASGCEGTVPVANIRDE